MKRIDFYRERGIEFLRRDGRLFIRARQEIIDENKEGLSRDRHILDAELKVELMLSEIMDNISHGK